MEGGRTNEPFPLALFAIKEARGISYPGLERLTKKRAYRKLSSTMINNIVLGKENINKDQIEIISAALKIDPMYFKEYREFIAMEKIKESTETTNIILDEDIMTILPMLQSASEEDKLAALEDFKSIMRKRGITKE